MAGVRDLVLAGLMALAILGPRAAAAQQPNSGAIGQIVPSGGIVLITGEPGAVVTTLKVRPGDPVKAGDLLMTLQSEALKAELDLARSDLQGAKKIEDAQVAAQDLAVKLSQQRLDEASRQLMAYRALGARANSGNETARLEAAENEAKVSLQIEQTKKVSVKIEADKAVQAAEKRLTLAAAATELHAPSDGTILKVDRRIGQRLGTDSAIQMGDLSTMYVTCQVYEGDLLTLKPGQKATVRSATLKTPIGGAIEEVARIVDTRSRLGEVRIRLDSAEPANRLVGMEVEVVIAH